MNNFKRKRYRELKRLVQMKKISHLEVNKKFTLIESYINGDGRKTRPTAIKVDFYYWDLTNGNEVVEVLNPPRSELERVKKKLFEKKYYPLTIKVV